MKILMQKYGTVSLDEFKKHFGKNEMPFHFADSDNDGRISHEEYHEALGHSSL
jgi:hypothetical protein